MITPSQLRTALITRVDKFFDQSPDLVKSKDLADNVLTIVNDLRSNPNQNKTWFALTMLTGQLPSIEQVSKAELWLRSTESDAELCEKFLGELTVSLAESAASTDLMVVNDAVIVLLVNIAKNDLHTGVQRVSRSLCKELLEVDQNIVFANVSEDGFSLCHLDFDFVREALAEDYRLNQGLSSNEFYENVLVPINCRILIPEVPLDVEANSRLSAIAESSSNSLACIGYDLIPILSPEFVSRQESERFTHYLSMTSRAKKILCISEQSAAEFRGFFRAKESLGAIAPEVSVIEIPVDINEITKNTISRNSKLSVLTVGTIEPRKGQIETLLACKKLWSEEIDLKITFVGKVHPEIDEIWTSLIHGLPEDSFSHLCDLSEQELGHLYSSSDLSIFVSKHEGYGLPIVESIMHGTPVLTTNFNPAYQKVKNSGAIGISTVDAETIASELRKCVDSFSKNQHLVSVNQDFDVPSAREYAGDIYRAILGL
jgi:glycosyltransferase involved in cell wall biosynthesis